VLILSYNQFMSQDKQSHTVDLLDVSRAAYPLRVSAAALQGLANRSGAHVFLEYGIYDDPLARRTNEDFMDDTMWYGKYRALLGNQDKRNLDYYKTEHGVQVDKVKDLSALVKKYRPLIKGIVVWDFAEPDTANLALMLAAQEDLLPVEAGLLDEPFAAGLPIKHDLRKRWPDRTAMYTWAFSELFAKCKPGNLALIEPAWQRPEFIDYVVQNKLFVYSLSSLEKGTGSTLLMLLAFGPAWLRELIFALRLDGLLRRLGIALMARRNPEVRLNDRIQRAVKSDAYPTIFGWHTKRDDELSFMLMLSANGLRLVPSHLAGNFSFHSQVKPLGFTPHTPALTEKLDPEGTYITFTLSDGDQLMMMSTAELGSWYSPNRGKVPFNWECQPLLAELAPALLEKFQRGAYSTDCLVAGPSGAGYIVPPLAPNLPTYMHESNRLCRKAGITVITTYVADPPRRVLRQLNRFSEGLTGYLAGYAIVNRAPQQRIGHTVLVANEVPTVAQIWDQPEKLLESVRTLAETGTKRPRFIGVHLFAYRTSLDDVAKFAASITDRHIHIVRGDDFLNLANQTLRRKTNGK
jgi:hypothetical protein